MARFSEALVSLTGKGLPALLKLLSGWSNALTARAATLSLHTAGVSFLQFAGKDFSLMADKTYVPIDPPSKWAKPACEGRCRMAG